MSLDPRVRRVVGCISLENWDDTWRRNQHFASRLVSQGRAARLVFVEPPVLGRGWRRWSPEPGVTVVRPPLWLPKRAGGLWLAGLLLRLGPLRRVGVLWVNDPQLGRHCLRSGQPTTYDVTDDWRVFANAEHVRERIVAAEDRLARHASTVVCSAVLVERWAERYAVTARLVPNAVDSAAIRAAVPVPLDGAGPHLGYVGTLHDQRLDVPLVISLAQAALGTVHLVGPDFLEPQSRAALLAAGVVLHGPVPTAQVPGWLLAMDVLLCPHLVNDFTLSLDAIKAHEYLATDRPIVATPTSGFQSLAAAGLTVTAASEFALAARTAIGRQHPGRSTTSWDERTQQFADALLSSG